MTVFCVVSASTPAPPPLRLHPGLFFFFLLLPSRWGRWKDILNHGRFKKQLAERDVESICRALLAYCLVHYRGDDKIKGFMWDLIAPTEDGQTKELQNHLGEERTTENHPEEPGQGLCCTCPRGATDGAYSLL